jgi:uncharacterized DUF497 family protein
MIEFDHMKNDHNIAKHGLPLDFAELLFDGPFIEEEDGRQDYGETRFEAIGPIEKFGGRVFVVIYTWRNNVRRIISFRKANEREVRKFEASDPRRG